MDPYLLRSIPAVHRFTDDAQVAAYHPVLGRTAVRSCVQTALDAARADAVASGAAPEFDRIRRRVLALLAAREADGLLGVINGTGVLLHTNFGRAPLAREALEAMTRLGAGYTNLEYDLETGDRGSRYDRVASQLRELSGAEAALVVNNCAAAVLLVLDTFSRGREVVVSRGQLIEIGGAFRLPDVVAKSGATLIEVGTTNRTYGRDYRDAWNPNTSMFMRTHPSNYRVQGFTAEVESAAMAALAKELGVMSFEDLGSGALIDLSTFGLPHEPTLPEVIAAGIDLVAVSGDKLLGGPQCGIVAGRKDFVDVMKRNPLLRALRVDKLTLAALSATLRLYLEPDRLSEIPFYAMLSATQDELLTRARAICHGVSDICGSRASARLSPVKTIAAAGGGTMPTAEIPSAGIAIVPQDRSPESLAADLRRRRPPIIGRIEGPALIVDLRTVQHDEDATVAEALAASACG
jgi:L-seryl-tRNA(Ser) seleniumtransferase